MSPRRLQYEAEGVGEQALQFRARQNLILEFGFCHGKAVTPSGPFGAQRPLPARGACWVAGRLWAITEVGLSGSGRQILPSPEAR